MVLIRKKTLYIGHIGDSRVVICREGQAIELTSDHHPSVQDESFRIQLAGGWVANGRLNGILGVSRSIGDVEYKTLKEMAWKKKFMENPLSNVNQYLSIDTRYNRRANNRKRQLPINRK